MPCDMYTLDHLRRSYTRELEGHVLPRAPSSGATKGWAEKYITDNARIELHKLIESFSSSNTLQMTPLVLMEHRA